MDCGRQTQHVRIILLSQQGTYCRPNRLRIVVPTWYTQSIIYPVRVHTLGDCGLGKSRKDERELSNSSLKGQMYPILS